MELPEIVKCFLEKRKEGTSKTDICSLCNGACCKGSGFAILENVIQIYEKYKAGLLKKEDYAFIPELPFGQFINTYFDDCIINGGLKAFFPKTLSNDNNLIGVPPFGSYWDNRIFIKNNNSWINHYGCIFLNRKYSEYDSKPNYCILHENNKEHEISAKPIDCVFLSCYSIKSIKIPTQNETNLWFNLLNYCFPNSEMRYQEILKK